MLYHRNQIKDKGEETNEGILFILLRPTRLKVRLLPVGMSHHIKVSHYVLRQCQRWLVLWQPLLKVGFKF